MRIEKFLYHAKLLEMASLEQIQSFRPNDAGSRPLCVVGRARKPQVCVWGDTLAQGSENVPLLLLDPVNLIFD